MALRGKAAWRAARVEVGGRLIAPLSDEYHGLYRTYTYYGCHCDRCTAANREQARESYRKRRARQQAEPQVPEQLEPQPQEPLKPPVAPVFTAAEPSPPVELDLRSASIPEPQPESEPQPAPEPAATESLASLRARLPPLTTSAVEHITTRAHLELVLEAYHNPVITTTAEGRDDLEVRIADGCLIRVGREDGRIVFVGEARKASDEPAILPTDAQPPKRRKRGGSGTRLPTSFAEIRKRLRELGCRIEDHRGHLRVTLPDGTVRQIPRTSSDHRAIANVVKKFSELGLDLRRA